jgi:hypothetical protein
MAMNYDSVNAQLARLPGYLEAVRRAPKYTRGEVARQFAAMYGIDVPAGAVDDQGRFYDPNADHWYSDPRVLGPVAVGAAAGGAGLFAAPAAATSSATSAAASSAVPSWMTIASAPAIASQGVSSATGGSGVVSALLGALKQGPAAVKNFLTSTSGLKDVASLAALLPLLKSGSSRPGTTNLPSAADNPFADLAVPPPVTYTTTPPSDARDALALQQRRLAQATPAFDALVNQAYGMTPTRYRGAPPDTYAPAAAPSDAYTYRGPQFG